MNLRRCESPGDFARIAALSADQAPPAIIGCPYMIYAQTLRFAAAMLMSRASAVSASKWTRMTISGDPEGSGQLEAVISGAVEDAAILSLDQPRWR